MTLLAVRKHKRDTWSRHPPLILAFFIVTLASALTSTRGEETKREGTYDAQSDQFPPHIHSFHMQVCDFDALPGSKDCATDSYNLCET